MINLLTKSGQGPGREVGIGGWKAGTLPDRAYACLDVQELPELKGSLITGWVGPVPR